MKIEKKTCEKTGTLNSESVSLQPFIGPTYTKQRCKSGIVHYSKVETAFYSLVRYCKSSRIPKISIKKLIYYCRNISLSTFKK